MAPVQHRAVAASLRNLGLMSSSRPNIWYVAHYAGGPGIGRHGRGWYLADNWREAGAKATVIAASYHHMLDGAQMAGFRQVQGVDYHFLATPPYHTNGFMRVVNMLAFTAAFRVMQDELVRTHGKPDAIIASSPHPFTFLATHHLARRVGAKSIFEVRDLWPASITEIMKVPGWHPLVLLTAAVERFAYKKADAVVSLLPKTENYMRERGLTSDRWHYIPNGIVREEKFERPAGTPLFEQVDTWRNEGHMIVSYTGALGRPNNVDRLLEAMAILKGKNAPVRALIVGRGDVENDLRRQCAEMGLTSHVRFFEQVPRGVARALQESVGAGFIALRPSPVFRFGISPNKIFDYMMSGLPVISAIDAGNDIVADARCGISVPKGGAMEIASAIAQLADMPLETRRRLGRNGRIYVERHHDYKLLARRYIEVLCAS